MRCCVNACGMNAEARCVRSVIEGGLARTMQPYAESPAALSAWQRCLLRHHRHGSGSGPHGCLRLRRHAERWVAQGFNSPWISNPFFVGLGFKLIPPGNLISVGSDHVFSGIAIWSFASFVVRMFCVADWESCAGARTAGAGCGRWGAGGTTVCDHAVSTCPPAGGTGLSLRGGSMISAARSGVICPCKLRGTPF